jgi:DNA (cytosine-5)-methyltransferase 1
MTAYYNDNDPFAAQWLRNLIVAGALPAGEVDERSIADVRGGDLAGFVQCHFFAGIGGWAYALGLAGWAPIRPVWTGSCPCQPYSAAGKRQGDADARNLWPEFRRLIAECCPATVLGEQVASKDGREWLAGVRADLENLGYAVGAADLCAAGVGAPHIRQRLFWVADAEHAVGRALGRSEQDVIDGNDAGRSQAHGQLGTRGEVRRMADSNERASGQGGALGSGRDHRGYAQQGAGPSGGSGAERMGNTDDPRPQGWREHVGEHADQRPAWATSEFIPCLDGKARRAEPSIQPLADGVSARVGRLRGYGNAIVAPLAAEFIAAFVEASA